MRPRRVPALPAGRRRGPALLLPLACGALLSPWPSAAGLAAPQPQPFGAATSAPLPPQPPPPGAAGPLPASGSPAAGLPAPQATAGCAVARVRRPAGVPSELLPPPAPAAVPPQADYRDRLATTAAGWPRLDRWCVWVEPPRSAAAETVWERRWREAVEGALRTWSAQLPLQRVGDPEAAQLWIRRRRPPLRREADGRTRASHGRALLELQQVERDGVWRLEPAVQVLLSPDQRAAAIGATAVHELGHAFGLWGHSDDPGDVMAAVPGAVPVLELSARDRATLLWLYAQPTRFGAPLSPDPAAACGAGRDCGEPRRLSHPGR